MFRRHCWQNAHLSHGNVITFLSDVTWSATPGNRIRVHLHALSQLSRTVCTTGIAMLLSLYELRKKSGIDLKPARSTRTSTHNHKYIAQPMTTAYNVWIVEVYDVTSVQGQLKLGCDISDKVSVATNRAKGKKEAMKGRLGTFTIIYACFDLKHQLKDNQHTDTSTRCLVTSQHKSPMLLNFHVCL